MTISKLNAFTTGAIADQRHPRSHPCPQMIDTARADLCTPQMIMKSWNPRDQKLSTDVSDGRLITTWIPYDRQEAQQRRRG